MQLIRFVLSIIYYLLFPIDYKKSWREIYGFLFTLGLLWILLVFFLPYDSPKKSILSYSPIFLKNQEAYDLIEKTYDGGNTKLAQQIYDEFLLLHSPTSFSDMEKVGIKIFPEKQLRARLKTIDHYLLTHPTSRDLWLEKAATSISLSDKEMVLDTKARLEILDPNNESVKQFLNSL